MSIVAYCAEWHTRSSDAFELLLAEPFRRELEVEMRPWDGRSLPTPLSTEHLTVFCLLPPPPEVMRAPGARVVWLPMWDRVDELPDSWWAELPRQLRVVAFSENVARRSLAAGLQTLHLQYHLDPEQLPQAMWSEGRILFYWNRTGMVSQRFLARLCVALHVDEVLYRPLLDPGIDRKLNAELPSRLAGAPVRIVSASSREEFVASTRRANIHLAPRVVEGVGLTFLEAMSRGCCVLAYDGPTMNEYIHHGVNGLLLSPRSLRRSAWFAARRLNVAGAATRLRHALPDEQDWRRIGSVDPEALGARAREDHLQGHAAWRDSFPQYRDFLLRWP